MMDSLLVEDGLSNENMFYNMRLRKNKDRFWIAFTLRFFQLKTGHFENIIFSGSYMQYERK